MGGREAEAFSNRWEAGLKIDIPEFHGGLKAEDFLDWLFVVEEVLEFKEVPENKRVPLVATRFRGRAAAWWQQLKVNRARLGKRKIESWDRLKKHLREAFLPHNYARMMYQKFQNLRQGTRMVDEYTTEFYQLMARNDLGKTDDQLVSKYIGGLQIQYQDTLNMFDLYSVSDAYQKALQLERQAKRRPSVLPWTGVGSRGVGQQETVRGGGATGGVAGKPPTTNSVKPVTSSAGRCFKCGEPGHRFAECKKPAVQKGLFIDNEGWLGYSKWSRIWLIVWPPCRSRCNKRSRCNSSNNDNIRIRVLQKREKEMTSKARRKRTPSRKGNQNGVLRGNPDTHAGWEAERLRLFRIGGKQA